MTNHPRFATIGVLAVLGIGLVSTSVKADAGSTKEVTTAATHAGFAAQAVDLNSTQTHLHHAINCLVGPKGQGFDDKEANPCKDQGNGAISDTIDEVRRTALMQALAKANEGLRQTDLAAAHKSTSEAQVLLTPKI
jgi:phosphatidate phosphatase APP1